MVDFIHSKKYFGLTARIQRLSSSLNTEARNIYAHLDFEIEPNWHLIFLLLKEKPRSVTEIAKQLHFSHPAIIKIVKKMKAHNYIQSIQDNHDLRRQQLSLTLKSKKLLPQFEREWSKIEKIMKEISTSEILNAIQYLEDNMASISILERFKKE